MRKTLAENFTKRIVGMVVGLVVAATVLPIALSELAGAEAANWGAAGIILLGLIGLFAAIGLIYYVLKGFGVGT